MIESLSYHKIRTKDSRQKALVGAGEKLTLISVAKNSFFTRRRRHITVVFSAISFACFSFFLFFALIDMILTVPQPWTVTISPVLSELAIGLIIFASVLFGLYNWRLAAIPTVMACGVFYSEYLAPAKLSFWAKYLVSPKPTSNGDLTSTIATPFWMRPDVDALALFLIGFCFLVAWQIHSQNGRITRALPRIFLVPAVTLTLFELIIGTINTDSFESSVVMGLRLSVLSNIQNVWVLDSSAVVIALCLLALFFFQNKRQTKP